MRIPRVFVSSTYEDLKDEREEVTHALLELGCFPSGMELFPATGNNQWEHIKSVINDCDYYIIIVGGRYGSINPNDQKKRSYVQMEYEHAASRNKPIMAFLHRKPGNIPTEKAEQCDEGKQKLAAFRSRIESERNCKHWEGPYELGGVVSRSMIHLILIFRLFLRHYCEFG